MPAQNTPSSRDDTHLRRLTTLIDCVYALVIVFAVAGLPTPRDSGWSGTSPWDFLALYGNDFLIAAVGLILVISYWLQSVTTLSVLRRSDGRHASMMIVQLLFLLVYLYGVGLGVDLEMHAATLLIQSLALMLMGITALLAWWYATRNGRLIADGVPTEELEDLHVRMIPEPATAALTLVALWFGRNAWEATWLLFPVLSWLLNRRKAKRRAQLKSR